MKKAKNKEKMDNKVQGGPMGNAGQDEGERGGLTPSQIGILQLNNLTLDSVGVLWNSQPSEAGSVPVFTAEMFRKRWPVPSTCWSPPRWASRW